MNSDSNCCLTADDLGDCGLPLCSHAATVAMAFAYGESCCAGCADGARRASVVLTACGREDDMQPCGKPHCLLGVCDSCEANPYSGCPTA
jgi:hypothetical protein